ncbi:MAG: hypothetical protein WBQ32_04210 [Ignavibacteriaceae bacterium]
MIRKVRSKVASSISKIDEADDFNFSNWLKRPSINHQPVDSISSRLATIPDLIIDFVIPENSFREFDFIEPGVTDELKNCTFQRVRSNAIFFMIPGSIDEGINYPEVELRSLSFSSRKFKFLISVPAPQKIKVQFDHSVPIEYNCTLDVPAIFNYLEDMVPEIFNIDLLEFEDLSSVAKKTKVHNIKLDSFQKIKIGKSALPGLPKLKKIYKVKVPSIGNYKSNQQKIPISSFTQPTISESSTIQLSKVKNWFAKFQLPKSDDFLFYSAREEKLSPGDKDKTRRPGVNESLREQLKLILSSVKKVDWEKIKFLQIKLREYEETGSRFLVDNDYALLQDELGIDIEKEVVAALKIMFGHRIIKSALIISSKYKIGNLDYSKRLNIEMGWSDKISKYCPELSCAVMDGNTDERAGVWNKSYAINIVDINTVINDFEFKILNTERLSRFDCIILDDAHLILSQKENGKNFISSLRPKILWATSCVLDKNLGKELNNWLHPSCNIENSQIRSKESISENVTKFILNEVWFEADDDQLGEFKVTMVDCKKELRRVLESGNPLRFTANIFTQLHRLNQVGNFAPNKSTSPKTELLLEHIKTIKENGKKALILSQYDRLGTKKIAELFSKNGIEHIYVAGSASAEELKKAISLFESQKEMVAFISDTKPSKLKFSDLNIPYVIRFDQWWNPINNWEVEDMFTIRGEGSAFNESVNIFNYYSLGTVDQKVRELLFKNGLLNKNVFELMHAKLFEELISVDEWLKIFEVPASEEDNEQFLLGTIQENIKKITHDNFRRIITKFFSRLGYDNLEVIDMPNSNSFNIIGKAQRNNRMFRLVARVISEGKLAKQTLEEFLQETSASGNDKVFIITKGKLPEFTENILRENVTLLDGLWLSKYLLRLGILVNQNE